MTGTQRFLGFGFGPIQAGLFLFEAQRSGAFGASTIAEVDPALVAMLRAVGGTYTVNVAGREGVAAFSGGPIEMLDPGDPADRALLIERVAEADEAATAVPSVAFYGGGEGSIAWTLARGLARRTKDEPLILYAAENHNHAAELLAQAVGERDAAAGERAVFLNTVIGKMSGVLRGRETMEALGLEPVVPGADRAFLVEEFNRILVSRPPRGRRAIRVFVEKEDLLPFEEAKLYGHNAAHALLAYLAQELGLARIADAPACAGLVPFVRAAFIEESGVALCRRYEGIDDLFTPPGFTAYVDDLIDRMTRASLNDTVERVARDPGRKLGYDDRFFGTLRVCRAFGTGGDRYAFGAACAFAKLRPDAGPATDFANALAELWGAADPALAPAAERAWRRFMAWRRAGRPHLLRFWNDNCRTD